MKTTTTSATALASAANVHALVKEAFDAVGASFERFCLMAGIESLTQMLGEDVDTLAGGRYEHRPDKPGYRWGQAKAQVGFHGGKIEVDRPRVRSAERLSPHQGIQATAHSQASSHRSPRKSQT